MIISLTNQQIEAFRTQIITIYWDAFIQPPYNKSEAEISDFAQSLPNHMGREAFRFVGAFESSLEQIVGFAYGYASTSGQWWYENVKQVLSMQAASEWLENSFQFVELAVSPKVQGLGIGGRLHDHLLSDLAYDRAVLSTMQANTIAYHLYRTRGWVVLRENYFFPGVERSYQIMGLELMQGDKAT